MQCASLRVFCSRFARCVTVLDSDCCSRRPHCMSPHLTFRAQGLGKRVGPRLRELAPCGQREPGGGTHATWGPLSLAHPCTAVHYFMPVVPGGASANNNILLSILRHAPFQKWASIANWACLPACLLADFEFNETRTRSSAVQGAFTQQLRTTVIFWG